MSIMGFTLGSGAFITLLSICLSPLLVSVKADCAPYPLAVPIKNVTLPNNAAMRGIALSVGSPAQNFSFMPQWPVNNTYVYDEAGQCGNDPEARCITRRGGQYKPDASRTHTSAGSVSDAGGYPNDANAKQHLWATDNFTINSNVTLAEFPLGIPRASISDPDYEAQAVLGLGSNSTILTALKSAGQIGSRTWSMFWGLAGATSPAQMDGSFVFGGYDSAKVKGNKYTQALSSSKSSCGSGLLVTITDIQLNFPNGSSPSLFDGSQATAVSACITADFPTLLTLPLNPYYQKFETLAGISSTGRSVGINFWGMLYGLDQVYNGDLTITLNSGLSVRIANSQFVLPDLGINSNGQLSVNESVREVVINSLQAINNEDLPILGRQFLTAAYLMVNLDANEFTLWQANPTTSQNLVAVNDEGQDVSTFCATSASSNNNNGTGIAPSTATTTSDHSSSGLSGGAIAGIAVGAAAVLAIIGTLIFIFIRRRHRQKTTQAPPYSYDPAVTTYEKPPTPPYASRPRAPPSEMASDEPTSPPAQGPYELNAPH